jgi:hypothetical protein
MYISVQAKRILRVACCAQIGHRAVCYDAKGLSADD